jgi:hypothetical protein
MKTLLAFLLLSGFAAAQPFPQGFGGQPAPQRQWRDYNLDPVMMAESFSDTAFRPRSYAQYLADNQPKMIVPAPGSKPMRIQDKQGRLQATIQTRPNGEVVVRDHYGRTVQTGTVRGGVVTMRNTPKGK